MPEPRNQGLEPINLLLEQIHNLHGKIEELSQQFRSLVAKAEEQRPHDVNRKSGDFWTMAAYGDSLVKIRLLIEKNFNYIESIGLLAVTRYLFELGVWLKLMHQDRRYGLIYYRDLLDKQLNYYKDLRNHFMREIAFLREVGLKEENLARKKLNELGGITDSGAQRRAADRLGPDIMQETDLAAARCFSIFAEQAQTNGYSFQAYLVETKMLPGIAKSLADIQRDIASFEQDVPKQIKKFLPKKWNWKQQASLAGMEHDYNFIYTYTSRLLHATPASLTTDQKNLEPSEMVIFLKYIYVLLLDIIEMADVMNPANGKQQ